MSRLFYLIYIILAGAALGIQAPINSGLGHRLGVLEGGLWSFATGTALMLILVLLFGKGHFMAFTEVPKWQLLGGILGVIGVTAMIVTAPQLGVGLATVCLLFGQITVAILIDSFGLFGMEIVPFDYNRMIGLVLMLAGVFFVYRSKFGA